MTHEEAVRKAQYPPTMPHGAIWLTVEEATAVVRAYLEARFEGAELMADMRQQWGSLKWNDPDEWDRKDEWWGPIGAHFAAGVNLFRETVLADFGEER